MKILTKAKFNNKHRNDIICALNVAYQDCYNPSSKRSYSAAIRALKRLLDLLEDQDWTDNSRSKRIDENLNLLKSMLRKKL